MFQRKTKKKPPRPPPPPASLIYQKISTNSSLPDFFCSDQNRSTSSKPPKRPPPPDFLCSDLSKPLLPQLNAVEWSTLDLKQPQQNLLEWHLPTPPKQESRHTFSGSVSSSFSSSASSLASSKKSFENDFNPSTFNWSTSESKESAPNLLKIRIIRTQQKSQVTKPVEKQITRDASPPMPNMPPPSPPKEDLDVVTPYGIALYEFPATQPGDLQLQVDDVVLLLKRVNKDWLYGRVGDLEGIFPQNFVRIQVPLPEANQIVTVLNEYNPQRPDMLHLKPGQKVRIISEASPEWLYGEFEGKTGSFPRSCVTLDP